MKIIDEKGKLFGKINVIDFLVLLFFLGLTPRNSRIMSYAIKKNRFLGRITEINDQPNPAILENSAVVKKVSSLVYSWQDKITNCAKTSALVDNAQGLKKELYSLPVQTGSFIVLSAIITNILLSLALHKEINTLGWIIRISLLIASWGGLSSPVQWEELKKTSWTINKLGSLKF